MARIQCNYCPFSQYRTILPTLYSMLWNWRLFKARPCVCFSLSCSLPFAFYQFSFRVFLCMGVYIVGQGTSNWQGHINSITALHLPAFFITILTTVCKNITLPIVDLFQHCSCITRTRVTQCILFVVRYIRVVCHGEGYWRFDRFSALFYPS